ncbi:MAG: (E)-4-hydroxy-3-methylbut-2-enyl-diphosphate synthase, partial [Akkermansiaceae bacterium]|nr:(E)-4-hydroxy-3-methylbut-2-enyl-diphosphate synthase [Akkermansiaceae bacterium]
MNHPTPLSYCPDLLHYTRRPTREVMVGNVGVGGENPIRVQSMITSDTRDTPACVAEVLGLAEVGCEIVRITAQTKVYAANLENIAREVRAAGCQVPLVADIHFKPDAALEAAKWVEKVRVNPGNYADKKKFEIREYSDAQYEEELERIREEFTPLVMLCKDLGRAMRIGTNHGSLSDRIMNRYGDTPLGMVESALEFARIARDHDYHSLVFSMKASNPKVMIEAYRLLVARLATEGPDWNYPIHLGVTEAGDGEDGRIKSAIGMGSMLADGIGDTVRVSLTEDSVHEIPVAQALVAPFNSRDQNIISSSPFTPSYDPFSYERRRSSPMTIMGHTLGGDQTVRVFTAQEKWNALAHKIAGMGDFKPEIIVEKSGVVEIDPTDDAAVSRVNAIDSNQLVTVADTTAMEVIPAFRLLAAKLDARHPILLKDTLRPPSENQDFLQSLLPAAQNIGSL